MCLEPLLEPDWPSIEEVKNGTMVQTKYEVLAKAHATPHLFIFSNHAPNLAKLSADRWNVINDLGDHNPLGLHVDEMFAR